MRENIDFTVHTYIDKQGKERTERVYSNEFLMNCEPSEELVNDLYESASLYLTFIVNMFKFTGHCNDTDEILKICTTNSRYMYEYTWTIEQRKEYENQMRKIMKNCLKMDDDSIDREIEVFSAFGGAFNLDNYSALSYDEVKENIED